MNDDLTGLENIDQQIRINELRESAREAAGGEMTEWESPDCPPELAEQFWGNVLAYESAGQTCHFIQLEELGIELPAPEKLDDAQLFAKLWEIIRGLAKLNVFLSQTDHLSDRELYELLWHDTLREITADLPPTQAGPAISTCSAAAATRTTSYTSSSTSTTSIANTGTRTSRTTRFHPTPTANRSTAAKARPQRCGPASATAAFRA